MAKTEAPPVTLDGVTAPVSNAPTLKPTAPIPALVTDVVDAAHAEGVVKRIELPTAEHVKLFLKLARKYAGYAGWAVRMVEHEGNAVHVSAKDKPAPASADAASE